MLSTETTAKIKAYILQALKRGEKIPVAIRIVVGLLLVILGAVFGFLPVLGYWMVPLGLALLGLSFKWTRRRIKHWMRKVELELRAQRESTSSQ